MPITANAQKGCSEKTFRDIEWENRMPDKKRIAVMFSGGTDSTYAAWSQIPLYDQIHLITFIRVGLRKPENIREGVARLRAAFTAKEITHKFIDFEDVCQKATPHKEKWEAQQQVLSQKISPLWEDPHGMLFGRERYDSRRRTLFMANECLHCKVAMHLAAIRFCKQENITEICDGSNPEQLDDGSQLEDVKAIAHDIFGKLGINYLSPVFHSTPEQRCGALYQAGITDHPDHKKLEKTHQIPPRQIQCTVPGSVLWTVCIFPWLVYDGQSCNDYIKMCRGYYTEEMKRGLCMLNLEDFQMERFSGGSGR
jgi:hypothetical protein